MARAPRAKVPKTSGQGVSRRGYQTGYSLGNRGLKAGFSSTVPDNQGGRSNDYAKDDEPKGFNISYGSTLNPTDLKDVKALNTAPPPRPTVKLSRAQTKLKKK